MFTYIKPLGNEYTKLNAETKRVMGEIIVYMFTQKKWCTVYSQTKGLHVEKMCVHTRIK